MTEFDWETWLICIQEHCYYNNLLQVHYMDELVLSSEKIKKINKENKMKENS